MLNGLAKPMPSAIQLIWKFHSLRDPNPFFPARLGTRRAHRGDVFRLCCLILALLVPILPTTWRNIVPSSPSWSQHRPKQAPRWLNHPIQPPATIKKNNLFVFFVSSASAKMLPKCCPNSPKASQSDPNIAILAHFVLFWRALHGRAPTAC